MACKIHSFPEDTRQGPAVLFCFSRTHAHTKYIGLAFLLFALSLDFFSFYSLVLWRNQFTVLLSSVSIFPFFVEFPVPNVSVHRPCLRLFVHFVTMTGCVEDHLMSGKNPTPVKMPSTGMRFALPTLLPLKQEGVPVPHTCSSRF